MKKECAFLDATRLSHAVLNDSDSEFEFSIYPPRTYPFKLAANSSIANVGVGITFIDTGLRATSRPARVHGHLPDHLSCGPRIFASLSPSSRSSLALLFSFLITGA